MWRQYTLTTVPESTWRSATANSLLNSIEWLSIWELIGGKPMCFINEGEVGNQCFSAVTFGAGMTARAQVSVDGLPAIVNNCSSVQSNLEALSVLQLAGPYKSVWVDFENKLSQGDLSRGWQRVPTSTQIAECGNGSAEWDPKAIRHLRSAQERGATIRRAFGAHDAGQAYSIVKESYSAHGRTRIYPMEFFNQLAALSLSDKRVIWLVCEMQSMTIGGHIALDFGDHILSWMPYMDRRFAELKPSYLLMREIFDIANQRGIGQINLGGTPDKADSLREFKSQFGARDYQFNTLIYQPGWARLIDRLRGV